MNRLSPYYKIALLFLLVLPIKLLYGQLIYVPTDDPVYWQIEELQARGHLKDLSPSERPWLISDVAAAIILDKLTFNAADRKTAESILEYLKPPDRAENELLSDAFYAGLGFRGLYSDKSECYFPLRTIYVKRDKKHEFSSVYHAGLWLSRENSWGFDTKLLFDTYGTRYPWYYGTPHSKNVIGQFDRAYFKIRTGRFDFLFGRNRMIWGPSPRGSLLLNDTSPPLDMLGYGVTLKPFRLTGFMSRIDDYNDTTSTTPEWERANRRFLSGHRLMFAPGKGWEFALSEIFLYGGPNRLPEFYYSIPIVLYYWEAQNRNLDDNAFWALDVSWIKSSLGQLYTQWVFDDIQRQHRGPQKWAAQGGVHLAPSFLPKWSAIIEFNFVDTWVFGQRKRLNAYLNWNWPIGRLDSDQREYFAGFYRNIGEANRIGLELMGRDKGEYDASDIQPNMAPFGLKFPSGVVEEVRSAALVASFRKWKSLDAGVALGFEKINNFSHEHGRSFDQPFISLTVSYGIKTGLPFWKKSR